MFVAQGGLDEVNVAKRLLDAFAVHNPDMLVKMRVLYWVNNNTHRYQGKSYICKYQPTKELAKRFTEWSGRPRGDITGSSLLVDHFREYCTRNKVSTSHLSDEIIVRALRATGNVTSDRRSSGTAYMIK
jgi:hypothetical protein